MILLTGRVRAIVQYPCGDIREILLPNIVSGYTHEELHKYLDTVETTLDIVIIDWEIIDDE
ncbi:hypothetical protein [Proteus phage VTCCBPA139]|uniref:Uncharacterized protein n=1 Tax=Proteus phage PM135 TaxID=2048008 RepID=A0A2H4PRM6_9CAUD|nr:hypothetical protein FDJ15_gp068 [Proteus phage PM135]ATW69951.1 hypothetical protein [Proteus phage PM135]QNN97883.1 hypothetical protein [Proteus phage 2]QOC54991.1 hypothetical protein [Proteus phage M4H10_20]QVQ56934.1 hypothetical protein [Proteus phage VTCCBPA139]